jgi:hypothetical protein
METWGLSYHERLGENKGLLGQLFDFFKCFVNHAHISNWLFVLSKTMLLSSKNCPDNRHGSVLVTNNRLTLLYTM